MTETISDLTNIPGGQDLEAFIKDLQPDAINILTNFLKACPSVLFSLIKAFNFHKAQENMEALRSMISAAGGCTQKLAQIMEHCKKCGLFKYFDQSTQERVSQNVLNEAETVKALQDGIAKAEMEMANSFLTACALSSAFASVLQYLKLRAIWGHVKDARNCYMDENMRAEINDGMKSIAEKLAKLKENMQKFENEKNEKSQANLLIDIEEDLIDFTELVNNTKDLVGKVEVEIKGKRQILIADSAAMNLDIIGNFAQLGTNLFQLYSGGGVASMGVKVCTGIALGAHAVAIGGTVVTKICTEKEIASCKKEMNEMAALGREIKKYKEQSLVIQKWVIRKKRELMN